MSKRKPGNPEGAESAPISIPRGGDWIDNWDGAGIVPQEVERKETPTPLAVVETPPIVELQEEATKVEPKAEPVAKKVEVPKTKPRTAEPTKVKAKATKKKAKAKSKRPKRADIGFRQDLEEASSKLRKLVIAQSEEGYVTRTDVVAQATCAVARAIDSIHCGQVSKRGHYGSPTAVKFDAALQEALYKGVALHFIEANVHALPDRLLQLCYEQYRLRNGLSDD